MISADEVHVWQIDLTLPLPPAWAASLDAQEQARAARVFQRAEAAADGGLVDIERAGCRAQCALAVDGKEDPGVIPIHYANP